MSDRRSRGRVAVTILEAARRARVPAQSIIRLILGGVLTGLDDPAGVMVPRAEIEKLVPRTR